MKRALSQQLQEELPKRLADLLALPQQEVRVEVRSASGHGKTDLMVKVGNYNFIAECKASGQAASVAGAVRSVRESAKQSKNGEIPLVAVPYMGKVGQRLCEEAKVSWMDLSGNASIFRPPGLRVHIEGKPNQFKRSGRPQNPFAPKSARIARWLLLQSDHAFTQRELAKKSGLDEGFTSRIVRQLEEQALVRRESGGAIRVVDYDTMLDAWQETYDFSKHAIVRGHVAGRSSDEVLRELAAGLSQHQIQYAATGLAGAWLLNQFAGFRLVVFYVGRFPSAEQQQEMGFHEQERGENVWLVLPNDEGVFQGAVEREGIQCVHPVQVYLDLKAHPERSAEAGQMLREKLLRKADYA